MSQQFDITCEWGPEGLRELLPACDGVILVDVLSFTTCVDIALSRGCAVYPYRWRDESSFAYARSKGALLAAGSRKDPNAFSLAPTSLLRLPEGANVVLPSLNGARLSLEVGDTPCFAACLRNAWAVANAAMQVGRRIAVIPAGERWEDGSLRPALEDWLGAGAVIACLEGSKSPEARAAEAAFKVFEGQLPEVLFSTASGIEMVEHGTARDVELAGELNVSRLVPRLSDGAYR